MFPPALDSLIKALRCLPGVGPKSAQRMAYYLLQKERKGALTLASTLTHALEVLQHCRLCNNFSETEVCELCTSVKDRDAHVLCVVESSVDMNMMELSHAYHGLYFILMGRLSPLDGMGSRDIAVEKLLRRVEDGNIREVILATNFTNEGEVTAHYIGSLLKTRGIKVSRIARGIPVGGELEFVDSGTLAQAVRERREVA